MKWFQRAAASVIRAALLLVAVLAAALLCSVLLAGIVGTWRGIAW